MSQSKIEKFIFAVEHGLREVAQRVTWIVVGIVIAVAAPHFTGLQPSFPWTGKIEPSHTEMVYVPAEEADVTGTVEVVNP